MRSTSSTSATGTTRTIPHSASTWCASARTASRARSARASCWRWTSGPRLRANECIVDSITLNDLEGTDLEEQLDRIRREHGGEPLRVGVVGVWTEAKVSFLLYELRTRLGIDELATCSALTASASRTQHFNALSQLDKILGVSCFDSLADFVDWLRPGAELDLPRHPLGFEPRIGGGEAAALQDGDRSIVAHLFRDSTEVDLDPLHGGYSDATVWRAVSRDALGQQHAPAVVKLGPNRSIAQERVAFEQVEDVLGNNAPRVRGFVDLGDRAGLKYSYAAMGQGGVRTLQSMFAADVPTPQLASLVQTAFDEILGPLYAAARYERLPLFSHYQFSADKAPHVRAAVAALVPDATRTTLEFPGGLELPNVCGFYDEFLARTPLPTQDYHYVSYVHGDLNAANILVDAHDNVWVIDFFHAGRGHVLKDLAKFENDLLYLLTPIDDDAQLREAISITLALREVADLRAPLADLPDDVRSPHLVRAWEILRVLRSTISQVCHDDRNPLQYQVAGLRYAVHTLGFPEPSRLQKQSALVAACSLADQIATTVEANLVLRVDWVESPHIGPGRLGMTICPGRRDRDRNLEADLARLRAEGVDRLLCLSTDAELDWAGVPDLGSRAEAFGLNYRWLPVPDQGTCSLSEAVDLVAVVSRRAQARRVGRRDVHGWARPERDDRRLHAGRRRRLADGRDRVRPGGAGAARARDVWAGGARQQVRRQLSAPRPRTSRASLRERPRRPSCRRGGMTALSTSSAPLLSTRRRSVLRKRSRPTSTPGGAAR